MAKLLQVSRPSKGLSNVVRAWLVAKQQRRRRRALAAPTGTPPAPVIVNGWCEASQTMEGYFDLVFDFTFDDAGLPVATFEVWAETGGRPAQRLAVIAGTERRYRHANVSGEEATFGYTVRYVNGGVVGPFSNLWEITTPA